MSLSYTTQLESLKANTASISVQELPLYSVQFVFRNLGPFKKKFFVLTLVSVVGSLLSFFTLLMLSKIISDIQTISLREIYQSYCPIILASYLGKEVCHYATRRYSEAFAETFNDYAQQTLYRNLLATASPAFLGFSKERLQSILGQYLGGTQHFLSSWFWGIAPVITESLLSFGVLYYQSGWALLVNLFFLLLFLKVATSISKRFAPYARDLSERRIEQDSTMQSLIRQGNTLVRFNAEGFFSSLLWPLTQKSWTALEKLRIFHARRWFLQLNLLNVAYLCTLFYAIYQVKLGLLGIGFLALLRYSYDRLWNSIIFVVEYVVQLTQEKQNSLILRKELCQLAMPLRQYSDREQKFKSLVFNGLSVEARDSHQGRIFTLTIGEFVLNKGDHVSIIGPSGAGKTIFYLTLLGFTSVVKGKVLVNGQEQQAWKLPVAYVSAEEPFFMASLRDNLCLSASISEDRIWEVLRLVHADNFVKNLDTVYGKPGVTFSFGQEQRLRLARGLLMDREITILDEAFSGLDDETKKDVKRNVFQSLSEKTVLMSSHDSAELESFAISYRITEGELIRISDKSQKTEIAFPNQ